MSLYLVNVKSPTQHMSLSRILDISSDILRKKVLGDMQVNDDRC